MVLSVNVPGMLLEWFCDDEFVVASPYFLKLSLMVRGGPMLDDCWVKPRTRTSVKDAPCQMRHFFLTMAAGCELIFGIWYLVLVVRGNERFSKFIVLRSRRVEK